MAKKSAVRKSSVLPEPVILARRSGVEPEAGIPGIPESVLEKVPAPLHRSYQLWWKGLWRRDVPVEEAEALARNAEMQARFYSAYVKERRKRPASR